MVKVFRQILQRVGIDGSQAELSYCLLFRYNIASKRSPGTQAVKAEITQKVQQHDIHILATFHKKLILEYYLI